MGVLIAVLCSLGLFVPKAFAAPEMSDERAQSFAVVLQSPKLREQLLRSGQAMKQNFTYASLADDSLDVLLVGETHSDGIVRHDVNVIIRDLAQAKKGFEYVASEFFLSSEQPVLNQFAQGKMTYDELRKSCKLKGRVYLAVVAKRYGLKVIGLDMPRAQENVSWAMSIEGLQQRNAAWAQIVQTVKKNRPRAKLLLYGGADHTKLSSSYIQTMPALLAKQGLKTKTVEFVNERDPDWKQLHIQTKNDILFVIPSELKPYIGADYVVYTSPQDLDEEGKRISQEVSEKLGKEWLNNDSVYNSCFYDPDNGICKQHLRVRRSK